MASSRGDSLKIISTVLGSLSIVTTVVRVLFRAYQGTFGLDDASILTAIIFDILGLAFTILEIRSGAGSHIEDLTASSIIETLKWTYITELFLFLILCATKVSICLFVLRIKNTGKLKWYLYFLISGFIVTTVPVVIAWFTQCHPIKAFWSGGIHTNQCPNTNVYNDLIWVQIGFSIFGDLSCSVLPIVILWNIRIAPRQKLAVCLLMSVGLLATASGIVRATLSPADKLDDLTYGLSLIAIWANLEIGFGIIGANLPLLRVLYISIKKRRASTNWQYTNTKTQRLRAWSSRRKSENTHVDGSRLPEEDGYPLCDGIQKTIDVSVVRDSTPQETHSTEDPQARAEAVSPSHVFSLT